MNPNAINPENTTNQVPVSQQPTAAVPPPASNAYAPTPVAAPHKSYKKLIIIIISVFVAIFILPFVLLFILTFISSAQKNANTSSTSIVSVRY